MGGETERDAVVTSDEVTRILFRRPAWLVLVLGISIEAGCMAVFSATNAREVPGFTGGLGALVAILAAMLGGPVVGAAVACGGWAVFFPLVAHHEAASLLTIPMWVVAAVIPGLLTRQLRAAHEERARLLGHLQGEAITRDFVMTASHELRTPLAAVSGAALTLANRSLGEPEQGRMLSLVIEQSGRLERVLDDLLSASKLEGGTLEVAVEPCDPVDLTREVVAAAQGTAPDGLAIELATPRTVPDVAADSAKLRQVLVCLIENAVKYSPDGGQVTISLSPGRQGLRFAVCDHGLGIAAAEQKRIFHKFYRLDPAMTLGVGGTGLGLYIASELVRRMGGMIDLISAEGAGSTFWFELPFAVAAPAASTLSGAASSEVETPARKRPELRRGTRGRRTRIPAHVGFSGDA
jgi:signal transduction histidine kinase